MLDARLVGRRVDDAVARVSGRGPDGREAVPRRLAPRRPPLEVLVLALELGQNLGGPEAVQYSDEDTLQRGEISICFPVKNTNRQTHAFVSRVLSACARALNFPC